MKLLPPRSAGQLAKRVRAFAKEEQVAEGRVRLWIANMALLGLIEGNKIESQPDVFVVKGGVAIELRLRNRARATRDLDLAIHSVTGDLVEILESALAGEFNGFTFRRTATPHVMPNGTVRVRIAAQYKSQSWTTVQVDASRSELANEGVEYAEPISLDEFGLETPRPVPCLSLPYQLAQKIHAFTQPGATDAEPVRTRDLVDALLLQDLVTDYGSLKNACVEVFSTRGTHPWPPESEDMKVPRNEFARIASEVGLNEKWISARHSGGSPVSFD